MMLRQKLLFLISTFCWLSLRCYAQCPTVDFSVPATLCSNATFEPEVVVHDAVKYELDFCDGSLQNMPTVSLNLPVAGIPDPYDLYPIEVEGNHYSFIVSYGANRIFRYDHGMQWTNAGVISDLGDLGIPRPLGVAIRKEGNAFFGIVTTESGKLFRLAFGPSITSAPVVTEIAGIPGLTDHRQLEITREGGSLLALIAGGSTSSVTVLNFENGIENQPIKTTLAIPTANYVTSIDLYSGCEGKFALVSTYGDGVFLLAFGESFLNPPIVTHPVLGGQRLGLSIVQSKDNVMAFVSTQSVGIVRVDFGSTITNNDPVITNLTTSNGINFAIGHRIVQKGTQYFDLSFNYEGRLRVLAFPKECTIEGGTVDPLSSNLVHYNTPGNYSVTLRAYNTDEVVASVTKTITVTSVVAPDLDFAIAGQCADYPSIFSPTSSGAAVNVANWILNDADPPVSALEPVHVFEIAGSYPITLSASFSNGCTSMTVRNVTIYNKPEASFDIPAGLLCSNNELIFSNETVDNFDGLLGYKWFVDGLETGSTRDLHHTFSHTGTPVIKLVASIPGCQADVSATLPQIIAGPSVNFSMAGQCEDENIGFTSVIEGEFEEVVWDLGDGNGSQDMNPHHIYNAGDFIVTLTAAGSNGCNNSKSMPLSVKSKPNPDFSIEGAPSSCSGYASQFYDLTTTTDEVDSWDWKFGDGATSTAQHPSHVFRQAGQYPVELVTTTEYGCSNAIVLPITILQSPSLSFDSNSVCVDKPVTFNAASDNAMQYYWEIGTAYYETQSATHTFTSPGSHPIRVSVVGDNDCVTTLTREVMVPVPFTPTFSYENNCKDFETLFTSVASSSDPISTYHWDFANHGTSSDVNPRFKFSTSGNVAVSLQVTTASGCFYHSQTLIKILQPPNPNFSFTPDFGVPPQEISFLNTSTNATIYRWDFGDSELSSEISPKHTFTQIGDFTVALTASNIAGCETSLSKVISMVTPLPDVDLSLMTVNPNADGTSKIIITIANNGNTFVKNLPVSLDVSGKVTLQATVPESIAPFSQYNLILNFGINQNEALEFLCASTTLEGDLNPAGNRICNQLKSEVAILTPYPNPAANVLTIEWVAREGEQVKVALLDANGKSSVDFIETSSAGLNQKTLDISRVRSGIYIVRITTPTGPKSHRILVSN